MNNIYSEENSFDLCHMEIIIELRKHNLIRNALNISRFVWFYVLENSYEWGVSSGRFNSPESSVQPSLKSNYIKFSIKISNQKRA